MKKSIMMFLLGISVLFLLIGCNIGKKSDDSDIGDSFEKTQKIEVIPLDGSDDTTISDDKDIKDFVDALRIDKWDSADIPLGATEGKSFKMYQKDTVKLGDSENPKNDLSEVATMTTYKDVPYLKFSVKDFSFNFKIPEDVSEYLNGYN